MKSCENLTPEVLLGHDYGALRRLTEDLAAYVARQFHASGLHHHDGEDAAAMVVAGLRRFALKKSLPKDGPQFRAYVYKTLRHRAGRIAKRCRRRREVSFEMLQEAETTSPISKKLAEAVAIHPHDSPRLRAAAMLDEVLSDIPYRDRMFWEGWLAFLRENQGCIHLRQYAEAIGKNANQTGAKKCRIRKRLRCIKN